MGWYTIHSQPAYLTTGRSLISASASGEDRAVPTTSSAIEASRASGSHHRRHGNKYRSNQMVMSMGGGDGVGDGGGDGVKNKSTKNTQSAPEPTEHSTQTAGQQQRRAQ
jgi:hypothetical protein